MFWKQFFDHWRNIPNFYSRKTINVEPKRKKETDELKSILEEIGVYDDVEILFNTVCDKIDEVRDRVL